MRSCPPTSACASSTRPSNDRRDFQRAISSLSPPSPCGRGAGGGGSSRRSCRHLVCKRLSLHDRAPASLDRQPPPPIPLPRGEGGLGSVAAVQPMIGFVAKRVALAVFVVLVVTLLVSWAIRLTGDPAV